MLVWLAALALAPAPAAAAAPDPATIQEALLLMDAEQFAEQAMETSAMSLEAMMGAMTAQIQKADPNVPEEFVEKIRETMRQHSRATMTAAMPRMKREAAEIYASEFSRAELMRMREIATDPVMVKARAKRGSMAPKLMMIGIRTMRDAGPALEAKIEAMVADYVKSQGKTANPAS
jgi:hypothetical protein